MLCCAEVVATMVLQCQNPRHKQHLKAFLKKYPTADDEDTKFAIIDVDPKYWFRLGTPRKEYCQVLPDVW